MGNCACCPHKYDLRKRQERVGVSGEPATPRSPLENFDSLPSSARKQSSSHSTPRGDDATPIDIFISSSATSSLSRKDYKIKKNQINGDVKHVDSDVTQNKCDVVKCMTNDEVKSFGSHSDLGSECLSMAYSSALSDQDKSHDHRVTFDVDSIQSNDVTEVTVINSLQSMSIEEWEKKQLLRDKTDGVSRPYMCSRLDSNCSLDSREIVQWKKGNKLGRGTFGTVWLGMTSSGELIAVKQMELFEDTDTVEAEKEYAKIYEEVSLLKAMSQKNIVEYYGSSYEDGVISVFMEYVAGGSLASIVQRFGPLEEPITARYTHQLLGAVTYLHANDIVHRDIKSANLMLMPEGTIRLIDFGCAKRLAMRLSRSSSHLQKSLRGTPYWMAPEVINETGHGKKSDIWSVGCTVFEILTGKPPWGDREPLAAIYAIGSDEFEVPALPPTFSDKAQEFVKLALIRDKRKRPHAAKLLEHHFVDRPTSGSSITSNSRRRRDRSSTT